MAGYKVTTDIFEGPLDLLMHLVSRQKLDVRDITVSDIADEFLEHIERMRDLDLDVASDFLLVASTLLELKARALFPDDDDPDLDDFDDMSPEEARELLVERLLTYRQFKSAASELGARMESEGRMHPRAAGLEEPFLKLMPDYLEGVTLRGLAVLCANLDHKREVFLLQAEHVASMPLSVELHMESVARTLSRDQRSTFRDLIGAGATPEIIVVTFLAILELYKRGMVDISQHEVFEEIVVSYRQGDETDG